MRNLSVNLVPERSRRMFARKFCAHGIRCCKHSILFKGFLWFLSKSNFYPYYIASQQAYAIIFGFIYITIIQNENPNEKCATVRCFYKGIFKGSGWRPRHPNKNPNEHLNNKKGYGLKVVLRFSSGCWLRFRARRAIQIKLLPKSEELERIFCRDVS